MPHIVNFLISLKSSFKVHLKGSCPEDSSPCSFFHHYNQLYIYLFFAFIEHIRIYLYYLISSTQSYVTKFIIYFHFRNEQFEGSRSLPLSKAHWSFFNKWHYTFQHSINLINIQSPCHWIIDKHGPDPSTQQPWVGALDYKTRTAVSALPNSPSRIKQYN